MPCRVCVLGKGRQQAAAAAAAAAVAVAVAAHLHQAAFNASQGMELSAAGEWRGSDEGPAGCSGECAQRPGCSFSPGGLRHRHQVCNQSIHIPVFWTHQGGQETVSGKLTYTKH